MGDYTGDPGTTTVAVPGRWIGIVLLTLVHLGCDDGAKGRAMDAGATDVSAQSDVAPSDGGSLGTIAFRINGKLISLPVTSECIGGHQNFGARDGATALFLSIFIGSPGTYECGEPLPYIFFQYQGPVEAGGGLLSTPATGAGENFFISDATGPGYAFNSSGGGGGTCKIVVTERKPRFKAAFSAVLDLAVGQGPSTVTIEEGMLDVPTPNQPTDSCL
ncbi:MAG: hypothetical protein ABI560_07270 [Myxococcales bacterium]